MKLSMNEQQALHHVAKELNVEVQFLYDLIDGESRWNPLAKNPNSSARGLIQFIDSTSEGLGYGDSLSLVRRFPTIESQLLEPVYKYLKQYAPFSTNGELFMAVFRPADRKGDYKKLFPEHVRKVNPKIDTPAHYVAYAQGLLNEYRSGEIKFDQLIKPNRGYNPAQKVVQPSRVILSQKKKIILVSTISILTLGVLSYHIWKK